MNYDAPTCILWTRATMSAEIVNLRRVRKAKAQTEKAAHAARNRAQFGRTKAEKAHETAEKDRARRTIDGAHRTPPTAEPDRDQRSHEPNHDD